MHNKPSGQLASTTHALPFFYRMRRGFAQPALDRTSARINEGQYDVAASGTARRLARPLPGGNEPEGQWAPRGLTASASEYTLGPAWMHNA